MSDHATEERGKRPFLLRIVSSRPYLVGAVVLGLVVGYMAPGDTWLRRALIGWDAGVWAYLVVMIWTMMRADHRQVRALAAKQDESAGAVLATVIVGTILSVCAIVTELSNMKGGSEHHAALHYAFTGITVIGSWLLVGVMYCFHYAHLFYCANKNTPPVRFPDEHVQPNYWDFLYFSFTLSVAVQTSDVQIMTRSMRKLVLGHSVLAFFFNLVILGLSVNIAASLINT